MKKNKNKIGSIAKYLMMLFVLTFFMNIGTVSAIGFGMSPPYVKNDKLTRGITYEQSIILSRSDANQNLKATAEINVPGADNWITIDKGNSFNLDKGKTSTPIIVKVSVPNNAEYKEYKGEINIKVQDPSIDIKSGAVGIQFGGVVKVDFKVVEQKINSFEIKSARAMDVMKGGNLSVVIAVENTGNVATAPTKAVLDVYDNDKQNVILSTENIGEIEKVEPFTVKEVEAQFDISTLDLGGYAGKVKFYNGTEVVSESEISITVMERIAENEKTSEGGLSKFITKLGMNTILYAVIAILALIIIVIIIVSMKKKKNSKGSRK